MPTTHEPRDIPHPLCFVSANTRDFAQSPKDKKIHDQLEAEFEAVSLKYFPSLSAALRHLRDHEKPK